mmetsp:Transcript_11579/g.30976  ORF Transcript_11579/g.30976 Transcript_11579/m.30976 type:complete len:404 (+) Transcript_11579:49-1260(+)
MSRVATQLVNSLRRWRADAQAAALERRLRQDPTNVRQRCAAVAFYCREANAAREEDAQSGMYFQNARHHLENILETTDCVDTFHAVLTQAVGPKNFYRLPDLTAKYMRRIGLHQQCLEEFDTRSEFEERATPYHFGNALTILKASGQERAASELFDEAVNLEWGGRRPIGWRHLRQTPAVYIEGLQHKPFWEGEQRPAIAAILEANFRDILMDLEEILARWRVAGQVPAYPNLVDGDNGTWDMLQLYSGRKWNEDACAMAPRTTALLRPHLPTADLPYVHYNTEEVVFFLLAPGSRVHIHNGGSNVPLNMSLGLRGCAGSHLEVAGETRDFQDGRVICFDDGSDHRVWHEGPEDRWVLTIRVMHPDLVMNSATYFARAFTNRTCFETWDESRALRLRAGMGSS